MNRFSNLYGTNVCIIVLSLKCLIRVLLQIYILTYTNIQAYMHAHARTQTRTHAHTQTRACTHARIHTHAHTQTRTYVLICVLNRKEYVVLQTGFVPSRSPCHDIIPL